MRTRFILIAARHKSIGDHVHVAIIGLGSLWRVAAAQRLGGNRRESGLLRHMRPDVGIDTAVTDGLAAAVILPSLSTPPSIVNVQGWRVTAENVLPVSDIFTSFRTSMATLAASAFNLI